MIYSSDNQTDSGNFVPCEVLPFIVSFDTEEVQVEQIIIIITKSIQVFLVSECL